MRVIAAVYCRRAEKLEDDSKKQSGEVATLKDDKSRLERYCRRLISLDIDMHGLMDYPCDRRLFDRKNLLEFL